jgi:hypothetical protein
LSIAFEFLATSMKIRYLQQVILLQPPPQETMELEMLTQRQTASAACVKQWVQSPTPHSLHQKGKTVF